MLVECQNCGAPLDVRGGSIYVRCGYCAKTNRVRTMRTTAAQTPAGWRPPPTWQPPPRSPFQSAQPLNHRPSGQITKAMILIYVVSFAMPMVASVIYGVVAFAPSLWQRAVSEPGSPSTASAPATVLDLDRDPRPAPITVAARKGVGASRRTNNHSCRGEMSDAPQLVLRTTRPTAYSIRALAPDDTVLVLETAPGEFVCDDDSGGSLNPKIEGLLAPGSHSVWLGVIFDSDDGTPATVHVRSANQALAPFAAPTLGDRVGLDAQSWDGQVAATVDASRYDGSCAGFVSAAPQVRVEVAEPNRMQVALTSQSDSLFAMVRGPDESVRCLNVSRAPLAFDLIAGVSTLWIGSMNLTGDEPYRLQVSW